MKKIVCLFICMIAGAANATVINFNESLGSGTQLEGNSFYDSYGVTFESSVLFGPNALLVDDGWGVFNAPGATAIINFLSIIDTIDITWATAGTGINFTATAFDASNNVVDVFFHDGLLSTDTFGMATLSGANISRLEFHDSGAQVAIDTLSFALNNPILPVPEPTALALIGLGIAGFGFTRRRKIA